jgi:hypothetical protein
MAAILECDKHPVCTLAYTRKGEVCDSQSSERNADLGRRSLLLR